MASAARAYSYSAAPKRGASIRVVPGKRHDDGISSNVLRMVSLFMIALAIFAIVAFVRIGFASATVTTSIETERLNAQVEQVRSGSAHLEVTESSLSNPTAVKETAVKKFGMSAPYEVDTIKLESDVIAFDEAGNLSLARSLSKTASSR